MAKYEILAFCALSCNLISFSHLIYNIYKTKNTTSLPWSWIFFNFIAQVLLIIYSSINYLYGILIPSIVLLLGLIYIFIIPK